MKSKGTFKLLLGIAVMVILVGIFKLTAQDNFGGNQDQRRNDMRSRMMGPGGQMGMMRQQTAPVMVQDEKYLYVCIESMIFKIDKSKFTIVGKISLRPKPGQGGSQGRSRSSRDKQDGADFFK